MANKTCLVCGDDRFETMYESTLLKCSSCGFVTANLDVGPELLESVYTENYFRGEEYLDYSRDKHVLQKNFSRRLEYILRTVPPATMTRALEIGCAYGFFAELISKRLPGAHYTGLDIVPEAVDYGNRELGQNLVLGDYLDYAAEAPYSDVFLWDVIEHLARPDQVLEKIHRELEDGGRVYVTTSDIEALVPRVQKDRWRMIHPPSHLHYFSAATIERLLDEKGFRLRDIRYPAIYRSVRQILYSLFLLCKKAPRAVEAIFSRVPAAWSVPINTFDVMFVIAEKKSGGEASPASSGASDESI